MAGRPTPEEAVAALRQAMKRYGLTELHATTGQCWCGPERRCAACGSLAACVHGQDRPTALVHRRAREALRLPDKRYPKEQLIGLVGRILHACPQLPGPNESPVVYGLQEAVA